MARATWKPHDKPGRLSKRSDLPDSVFAFPEQRKEPMTNAAHVRNALARFDQVEGVSDGQRSNAFANIKRAAAHFGVDVSEQDWQELGRTPSKRNKSASRSSATEKKQAKAAPKRAKKVAPKRAKKVAPRRAKKVAPKRAKTAS